MSKIFQLFLALGLIVAGILFMIAWEHPLAEVWAHPALVLWDPDGSFHVNRVWFVGPTLIVLGVLWIAEDWFNLGREAKHKDDRKRN